MLRGSAPRRRSGTSDGLRKKPKRETAVAPAGTALTDEEGNPVPNTARNTWVTATALSTALNQSYVAERLALFGIVVGIALILSGIGFLVLALGGALRHSEAA